MNSQSLRDCYCMTGAMIYAMGAVVLWHGHYGVVDTRDSIAIGAAFIGAVLTLEAFHRASPSVGFVMLTFFCGAILHIDPYILPLISSGTFLVLWLIFSVVALLVRSKYVPVGPYILLYQAFLFLAMAAFALWLASGGQLSFWLLIPLGAIGCMRFIARVLASVEDSRNVQTGLAVPSTA